jgi:hypothetical protein
MNPEPGTPEPTADELIEARKLEIATTAARIESAVTLAEKSEALWAMNRDVRHDVLGTLPAQLVATLIETDPERNTALLGSVPAAKFQQIINLGTPTQGRQWMERAVESGQLAATFLPSLLNARDLSMMLLTSAEVRRALPKLLNFDRASRWQNLMTPSEWHQNFDNLLISDTEELLEKASFKNKSVKAVLRSVLDYVPELYLETIRQALDRAKHAEDYPDELEDITTAPFAIPEINAEWIVQSTSAAIDQSADSSPTADALPEGGDPILALATIGLPAERRKFLEDELKQLLREEIIATASFAQQAMERAGGRVLFYLRAGLAALGSDIADATKALASQDLHAISTIGARTAEGYRQKALALAGLRDWLDSRQKQFLEAMKTPEAGLHPETREPVFWLASKPKQDRADWHPTPLSEISDRLSEISVWGPLARAVFGSPERIHAIFMSAKTRTSTEALRRTIVALALFGRWEPELVRPEEDYQDFYRRFPIGSSLDSVRHTVLDALESSPDDLWKPSDAKSRAREMLLKTIDDLETNRLVTPRTRRTHD